MEYKQPTYNKDILLILARELIDLYKDKPDASTLESINEISFALMRLFDENSKTLFIEKSDIDIFRELFDTFDRLKSNPGDQQLREDVDRIYNTAQQYFKDRYLKS